MGNVPPRIAVISPMCVLALALSILTAPVEAKAGDEGISGQRCRSEFNSDPDCSKRERRRINAQFGLSPLEDLYRRQAAGSDLIIASASFKLGGGLAMVFQKDRSGKPVAEIRRAAVDGLRPKTLRVGLSEAAWRTITAKSRTIDTNVYQDDRICVGGAGFTLQTIDHLGTFRARLGDICGEHPGNRFFDELAKIALAELPLCAGLAPEGYAQAWAGSKLYDCFLLSGEQNSAAAAYNFLEGTNFWSTWNSDETGTRARLSEQLVFRWPGRSLPESGSDLARYLSEQPFESFRLTATSYVGEAGGNVIVRGRIKTRNKDEDGPSYRDFGTFRSVWVKHAEYGFRLSSFTAKRS